MSWFFEKRASTILFNVLKSLKNKDIEFLIPANVCPIVPATFLKASVKYSFVDISEGTLCLDLEKIKIQVSSGTNLGLLYVRNLGIMDAEAEIQFKALKALNSQLFIIDDRCPARIDFQESYSKDVDVVLYSTGYAKYVEFGSGGCAFLNERVNYERQVLSFEEKDHSTMVDAFNKSIDSGNKFNYQESDWLENEKPTQQFEVYKEQVLAKREEVDFHKNKLNSIYLNEIPSTVLKEINGIHTWRFNIFVEEKEKLIKSIFDIGLFASSHYACISHLFKDQDSPIAQQIHASTVNLFNDFRFKEEHALATCQVVKSHIKKFM